MNAFGSESQGCDAGHSSFRLFHNGIELDKKSRRELLQSIKADDDGDELYPEVTFSAVTYIQRPEPNRNFVRFKQGILSSLAKSYKTVPFLKDHATYDLDSRGGTVQESKANKLEGQVTEFEMSVEATTGWAVLGLLGGTIDRFSIGWSRTGEVDCSVHGTPVFTKCDCYPGDQIGNDVVEFIFTAAEGTEVSAVNVPAVVGTGITTITKLSSLSPLERKAVRSILAVENSPQQNKEDSIMQPDPQLLVQLGLPATAGWPEVNAAIAKLNASNADIQSRLALAQREADTREASERKTVIDTTIAGLCAAGKIAPGSDVESKLRALADAGSEMPSSNDAERNARQLAMRGSLALFRAQAEALKSAPSVTPAGNSSPTSTKDPVAAVKPADVGPFASGPEYLKANPSLAGWLRNAGITSEQFDKHGALGRAMVSGMFHNAPPPKS